MREQTIFIEALDRDDPAERDAFLAQACASDAELRQRIERLLQHHQATDDLLEGLCESPTVSEPIVEATGTAIGPYKLLEVIGEGGMGTVYLAEQSQPVRRRVALKIIKPGMDTKQVIARFEAERQALALMDHPNIARVLDGGATPEGRPFFVMELVKGVPITDYCDRQKLSIPERLELFVLVCRAVQHAHQKGIIHRDIKPSNVMVTVVDGVAVPKVIDFGVAKATGPALTDLTLYTGFHQFVGTPLYISPEQADLCGVDVDTRSDIYALGVLLYELLTGTTPFDVDTFRNAAFDDIRRILREQEPPTPSTRLSSLAVTQTAISANRKSDPRHLTRTVRGELDWIVMKAMEKDRRRRYETANGLAADILRYLNDEPVTACPPSSWYRFRKFAHRNRSVLTTAGLVAVALIAGTAVSVEEAVRARKATVEAQRRSEEVRQVVDYLVNDVFGAAAPGGSYDRSMTVGELFDRADDVVTQRFSQQPLVEASVRLALARSYLNIGDTDRAEPHAVRALAIRTHLLGADHPETLQTLMEQAKILSRAQRFERAEEILRYMLAAYDRRIGPSHAMTLESQIFLAYVLYERGLYDEAHAQAERAEALALRHLGNLHPMTLYAWDILGQIVAQRGDRERGAEMLRRAIAGREATLGPLDPSVLWCMQNLAMITQQQGRLDEARQLFLDLVDRNERLYGLAHANSSTSLGLLIALHRDQGDHIAIRDTSEDWLRKLLVVPREADAHLRYRRSVRLAYTILTIVTLPEAIPFNADLAVRAAKEVVALDDDWDDAWTVLGVVYYRLGRLDDAMQAIQNSMARPRWEGGDDFDWLVLALIHARRGEMDQALQWYDQARNREDPVDFNREDLKPLRDEAEVLLGLEPADEET